LGLPLAPLSIHINPRIPSAVHEVTVDG